MANTKRRARRPAAKRHTFTQAASGRRHQSNDLQRTAIAAPQQTGFDALILGGTCAACKQMFKNHFNGEGRFVGCNPNTAQQGSDEFITAPMFVPPVIVPSAALNHVLQSRTGALIVPPVAPAEPLRPKFGRPADLIYPSVEAPPSDSNEKAKTIFDRLIAHRDTGITLRSLVDELDMPYSTVQTQVNKLVTMKAAEKRSPEAAA